MSEHHVSFKFEILYRSTHSGARVGRIHTPHGIIDTPNFVAVGTNGTLKALDNHALEALDLQLMFCNTYHLILQPGTKVIKAAGGLHSFINRPGPIITDSGGFQVFSLMYGGITNEIKSKGTKSQVGSVLKIQEEGVLFRSYRNGDKILLTPESSIQAQKDLGADIIIPLDELPPYHIDSKALLASFERTHRWALRSLETHRRNPQQQAIYAVIHGGIDLPLRRLSCELLGAQPFDGYGIGGSLGQNQAELLEVVGKTASYLPEDKPIHLLGIGDLNTLDKCISFGIDTFDSSYPTKAARHGVLFTMQGIIRIKSGVHAQDWSAIEAGCPCYTCQHYTKAYVHHLFKAHEPTALSLASLHNVSYMMRKMAVIRAQILDGQL